MLECESFSETLTDFAECAVCWTDTRLRCADCGDPVCHNCEVCRNGCAATVPPPIAGYGLGPYDDTRH
jgi:hypothetical protein